MKKYNVFFILIIFSLLLSSPFFINAQEDKCEDKEITVIARNAYGNFIPDLNFEVYCQTEDVDGIPKPCARKGGGKISSILGSGVVSFNDKENNLYCLKMWDKNQNVGDFWFYSDVVAGCGESVEVTEYLSGIKVILRDTEGELVKNKDFTIYTQRNDEDGKPIKEKNDKVATLDSSEEGMAIIYVPDGSRGIDGDGNDYYIFEAAGDNGGTYIMYDVLVSDGSMTEVEYVFSDILINLQDNNGIPFPANTKIEIYEQAYNVDDEKVIGTKIKDITTDDQGMAIFEYPAGTYAARVLGADGQYQYFWDLEIVDQARQLYTMRTGSNWDPGEGACEADSTFTLITKNLAGNPISGLSYELYEKTTNVNGVPAAGEKFLLGKIDDYGKGVDVVNPDPRKSYILKVYESNKSVGEFWYFDNIQFTCGEDITMSKSLPSMNIVLRDGNGDLVKNRKFSIYTQKFDVDSNPIKEKEDLVTSLSTSEEGIATLHLAPDNYYFLNKKGMYVLSAQGENNVEFVEYNINVIEGKDLTLEYMFSDIIIEAKSISGKSLDNINVDLYQQIEDYDGNSALGKKLKSVKTDNSGSVRFEYPSGYYAAIIKDDLGKQNVFWNIYINNRQRTKKDIVTNQIRINAKDEDGYLLPVGTVINIYSMKEESGLYITDAKIGSVKFELTGYKDISLAPGPYLFYVVKNKENFGEVLFAENGKSQEITLISNTGSLISLDQKFKLSMPNLSSVKNTFATMGDKLKGYILLQVEAAGEAWYVDIDTKKRYYMENGSVAYDMMRDLGLGITNENLEKIPVGVDSRFNERDTDGDGLFDKMEEALGTDLYSSDTDGDGYSDNQEVLNGYNPLGNGKISIDANFADKLKGRILLQVESRGEAWYLSPEDGKRYYMKDGDSAYEIMRFLSLGITDSDLEKIETGY